MYQLIKSYAEAYLQTFRPLIKDGVIELTAATLRMAEAECLEDMDPEHIKKIYHFSRGSGLVDLAQKNLEQFQIDRELWMQYVQLSSEVAVATQELFDKERYAALRDSTYNDERVKYREVHDLVTINRIAKNPHSYLGI